MRFNGAILGVAVGAALFAGDAKAQWAEYK